MANPPANTGDDSRTTVWPSLLVTVVAALNPGTTFPKASSAMMLTAKPMPAVAVPGTLTRNWSTAAGLSVMIPLVPVVVPEVAVSVNISALSSTTVAVAIP